MRRPASVNAAQIGSRRPFTHRASVLETDSGRDARAGPWLCLTHPDDIKRVFLADTDVLRLGAALAKLSPHTLVLGPTGLTNVDGADHARKRRMQNPPFNAAALAKYQATMARKTNKVLTTGLMGGRRLLSPRCGRSPWR